MKTQTKITLLTFMVLCETGCFFLSPYSISASTIIYTIAGITISILPLIRDIKGDNTPLLPDKYRRYTYILYIAVILLICNWVTNMFRVHVSTTRIDQMADMLLFIREMAQRFIDHRHVYDPVSDVHGFPVRAVYLPAFWLPYTIPVSLGIDMRWLSFAAFIGTVIIAFVCRPRGYTQRFLLLLPPLALLSYLLLDGAAFYFMHTQETIVLFYVAILAWALLYDYWISAGIAAALCILSRYYIGVPLIFGIIWLHSVDRSVARRAFIATVSSIIVLLTISRSWGDISYFCHIPFLYMNMLSGASAYESFLHIYHRSVGFAGFSRPEDMHIITTINMVALFIVPAIYFLLAHYLLKGRRKGIIILCGIKLFLVFFLVTLSIPFGYVLYTSSIVSIMLLRAVLARTDSRIIFFNNP